MPIAELDPVLAQLIAANPYQLLGDDGLEAARGRLRELPERVPSELVPRVGRVDNHHLDIGSPDGIGVRIYWPPDDPARTGAPPLLMFFHGGGFCVGDLDTHDLPARFHCVGAGAVVVSVDYRLAPEHPFPAAIEDTWAATQWAVDNATTLGADATRMAVTGDSAGGTIAAVIAQLARDARGPAIAYQLLWYPAPMRDHTLPSYTENADAPVVDRRALEQFHRWYAGDIASDNPPPTLAPGRNPNLAGLPPAYIGVAGHDPVRDEGLRYAELLRAAGVPVETDIAQTLVHGFIGFAGIIPAATEATDRGVAALTAALYRLR
jgi:acetyl esterase